MNSRLVTLAGALLACGASTRTAVKAPPASYLRASPIIEYGPPSVEPSAGSSSSSSGEDDEDLVLSADRSESAPLAQPVPAADDELVGDLAKSDPASTRPVRSSSDILAEANATATQSPDAETFINGIATYLFSPGTIFEVITAPDNSTALLLEPGEEIRGQPVGGDILRWRLVVTSSTSDGVPQQQVFIKPTRAGLTTNLAVPTNRRTYFIKLESVEGAFMTAVQWNYPHTAPSPTGTGATPAITRDEHSEPAAGTPGDVTRLNFDYGIDVVEGRPRWKPKVIYDDGRQTFIRFDASVLNGEVPVLYVIERGEMQLVNYRVKADLYVVDRLFDVAELRLGQDEQDVIRIRNRRRSSSAAPARPGPSTSSARRPGTPR